MHIEQAQPPTHCICILTRSTDDPEAGFLAICIVTERKQNLIMTLGITYHFQCQTLSCGLWLGTAAISLNYSYLLPSVFTVHH